MITLTNPIERKGWRSGVGDSQQEPTPEFMRSRTRERTTLRIYTHSQTVRNVVLAEACPSQTRTAFNWATMAGNGQGDVLLERIGGSTWPWCLHTRQATG